MSIYFSPSTGSFYDDAIHGAPKIEIAPTEEEAAAGRKPRLVANPDCKLPPDAKLISDDVYADLMQAQAEGKQIVAKAGRPVALDRVRSAEEIVEANRRTRDRLLRDSDWTQLPDALLDEPEYKAAMAVWRQALRDMDLAAGTFPDQPNR